MAALATTTERPIQVAARSCFAAIAKATSPLCITRDIWDDARCQKHARDRVYQPDCLHTEFNITGLSFRLSRRSPSWARIESGLKVMYNRHSQFPNRLNMGIEHHDCT